MGDSVANGILWKGWQTNYIPVKVRKFIAFKDFIFYTNITFLLLKIVFIFYIHIDKNYIMLVTERLYAKFKTYQMLVHSSNKNHIRHNLKGNEYHGRKKLTQRAKHNVRLVQL